jgi:hypothetical protein
MKPEQHFRRMMPVLIETLVVGSIVTGCIFFLWGAVQLVVGWL